MLRAETNFIPVLADRSMVSDALVLLDHHGGTAGDEARTRARNARNQGNIHTFCRWRQIERLIGQLTTPPEAGGTSLH